MTHYFAVSLTLTAGGLLAGVLIALLWLALGPGRNRDRAGG
jgi:hypothetical protein